MRNIPNIKKEHVKQSLKVFVSMIFLKDFYGISEGVLWEFYGILMGFPLDSYEVFMVFL